MKNELSKVNQAAHGISYLLAGSTAQMLFRLVVIGVLARHLTPTDFGIVAAAMIVVSVLDLEGSLGIAPALIQRKELEPRHLETSLTICLFLSPGITWLLYLASPIIADWLSIPKSVDALRVLSAVLFFRTVGSISEALLYRKMQFSTITATRFVSFVLGYGVFGVALALFDFGYWSLVYAEIIQAIICAGAFIWCAPLPRKLGWDTPAAKELFGFGISLSGAKLIRQIIFSIDQMLVARYFGAAALGFYTRANGTTFRPINALGSAIESVLFPMLSAVQDDIYRVRGVFVRGLALYAIFVAPVVATTAILAYEIVQVMLGPGWEESAYLIQLLAVGFFVRTANRLCATILKSRGKAFWLLVLQIEHGIVVITCLVIGMQYGLAGIAIGASVAQVIHFAVTIGLVLLNLGGGVARLGRTILGAAPIAVGPIVLGAIVHHGLTLEGVHWIIVGAVTGFVIGAAWLFAIIAMPAHILGADGTWIFQSLASLVPSKIPAGRTLKRWIGRNALERS